MTLLNVSSSWDRSRTPKQVSPAFIFHLPKVIFEFENRGRKRIFSHTPAYVRTGQSEIAASRDRIIKENLSNGLYHSISNTHVSATVLDEENTILAHGAKRSDGYENCSVIGAECVQGDSDGRCERGKCAIGRLSKVQGRSLWRYDSLTVPGLYYYVKGERSVELKHVGRGKFTLPAGSGTLSVSKVASIATTIYLPPSSYSQETFTRRIISYYRSDGSLRSLQDSCDDFVRLVLGTDIGSELLGDGVRSRLDQAFISQLPDVWADLLREAVTEYADDNPLLTNKEFLIGVYELLSNYYNKCVQESVNGFKPSKLNPYIDISRPVYNRLPGISGAYNSQDEPDNPSKWLVSGADESLSHSKTLIDRFYSIYLDPETAYPLCLDWIAQHMGFVGGMWDLDWDSSVKRLLLKNAHVNSVDENDSFWTRVPSGDTLTRLDRSRIEGVEVNGSEVQTAYHFMQKIYNTTTKLTSLAPLNTITVDVSEWPGLIPARGSMASLLFLFKVFGIRAITGEELVYDAEGEVFRVRSGLRRSEQNAPINIPYGCDVLHVGTEEDAEVGNYPNQLIAGVGVCQDNESSNTVVIRLPFYYNRDGRTWDTVNLIVENWMPATVQSRVQYGYAAAGLLAADDVFFEPEVV